MEYHIVVLLRSHVFRRGTTAGTVGDPGGTEAEGTEAVVSEVRLYSDCPQRERFQ